MACVFALFRSVECIRPICLDDVCRASSRKVLGLNDVGRRILRRFLWVRAHLAGPEDDVDSCARQLRQNLISIFNLAADDRTELDAINVERRPVCARREERGLRLGESDLAHFSDECAVSAHKKVGVEASAIEAVGRRTESGRDSEAGRCHTDFIHCGFRQLWLGPVNDASMKSCYGQLRKCAQAGTFIAGDLERALHRIDVVAHLPVHRDLGDCKAGSFGGNDH